MSDYAKNLLDAINIVVQHAVSTAQFDRTIQATIISCKDEALGIYKVKYQDSIWQAHSANLNVTYTAGTGVYVLVPGNDMSSSKTIIGAVNSLGLNYVEYISSEDNFIQNGISVMVDNPNEKSLSSYAEGASASILIYDLDDIITDSIIDITAAQEYLRASDYILLQADFRTDLPKQQRREGNYGLEVYIEFDNPENIDVPIVRKYVLDIDDMVGNPYLFTTPLTQKAYFAFDGKNFKRIVQIKFFEKDFANTSPLQPDDLFISNIKIIGANAISMEEKQGVSLRFKTPNGKIFTSDDTSSTQKEIIAQIRVSNKLLSSTQQVQFYWFQQDASIEAGNTYYCKYGGKGWKCLNTINSSEDTDIKFLSASDTFKITKGEATASRTQFKCVALYNGTELSNTFQILNTDSEYTVEISCNKEPMFYPTTNELTLTCTVKRNNQVFTSNITYNWRMVTDTNSYYNIGNIYSRSLTIQANNIRNYNDYYCSVYGAGTLIGTASLRVIKKTDPDNRYVLSLVNGVQLFNYDELGNSPYNNTYVENSLTIPELSFSVIDMVTGLDVTDQVQKVVWRFPLKDSMLTDENLTMTPPVEEDDWRIYTNELQNFVYGVANRYNTNYTNNIIKLKVLIHGIQLQAATSFTFTKEGEAGTNGTGIVCKIIAKKEGRRVSGWLIGNLAGLNTVPTLNWDELVAEIWRDGECIFSNRVSSDANISINWSFLSNADSFLRAFEIDTSQNSIVIGHQVDYTNILPDFTSTYGFPANILKLTVKYNGREYYDTVPIVTVQNLTNSKFVELKNTGFKYVTYSQDGENPQYDDTLPFAVQLSQDELLEWRGRASYCAGINYIEITNNLIVDTSRNNTLQNSGLVKQCYFKPSSLYNGLSVTNCVIIKGTSFWIHIPIHFMYNRYGHKQLNGWDGNSIAIDNSRNFILAPQIGAGIKNDNDNSFTGLFMGAVQQYNSNKSEVGLFGYDAGIRTIFLDAKTGKAEFGKQGAGLIKLNPANNEAIIEGGQYVEASDDIFGAQGSGMRINLTNPQIKFGSGNFILNESGLFMKGSIEATQDSTFGPLKINTTGVLQSIYTGQRYHFNDFASGFCVEGATGNIGFSGALESLIQNPNNKKWENTNQLACYRLRWDVATFSSPQQDFGILQLGEGSKHIENGQNPLANITNKVVIRTTGYCNAIQWTNDSDERLKNIYSNKIFDYKKFFNALNPIIYKWKPDFSNNQRYNLGFSAQGIEKILKQLGYSDFSFVHKDEQGYLSLSYNQLFMPLIPIVQQQQKAIEKLEQEIKELKGE